MEFEAEFQLIQKDFDIRALKTIIVPNQASVVAQMAERSLPTPEIRGLNPNMGKNLSVNCIM